MYALLVVEMTGTINSELTASEYKFLEKTLSIEHINEPATKLSRNCWLISLQKNLPEFYTLLRQATESSLPYRVTFFEKEPAWCHSKP